MGFHRKNITVANIGVLDELVCVNPNVLAFIDMRFGLALFAGFGTSFAADIYHEK